MVVEGPAVSGPALLLGIADFVVMTADSYAFVSGPAMVAEFTGVAIDNEELGGAASHARYTGAASLVAADLRRGHRHGGPATRLPPAAQRRGAAAAGRPTIRRIAKRPRPATLDAADLHRQLRRARRDPGDLRRRRDARAARPLGTERRHGVRRDRRRCRSASSPTSRWRWPARSTSRPRRRRPGSSRSATRSTCRS